MFLASLLFSAAASPTREHFHPIGLFNAHFHTRAPSVFRNDEGRFHRRLFEHESALAIQCAWRQNRAHKMHLELCLRLTIKEMDAEKLTLEQAIDIIKSETGSW